jgi:hypothetical protein
MLTQTLFILVLPWIHVVAKSCDPHYSQVNFKLEGHVNKTISSPNKIHCVEKCFTHVGCRSINFYPDQDLCELNDANHLSNPESVVYSPGSQFVNNFKRPLDVCSSKLCSEPLTCIMNKDGQTYRCVTCQGMNQC